MGQAFTPPSRDFLRELQVLRREVDALKRMPSGSNSISAGYLAPVPACRVYRGSSGIALATSTSTGVTYTDTELDVWGMHDTATNQHRVTAPIAGWYSAGAISGIPAAAGGSIREMFFVKNADGGWTGQRIVESSALPSSAVPARMSVSTVTFLNAGDWLSCVLFQNSGGSLTTENTATVRDEFWMCWLGN